MATSVAPSPAQASAQGLRGQGAVATTLRSALASSTTSSSCAQAMKRCASSAETSTPIGSEQTAAAVDRASFPDATSIA